MTETRRLTILGSTGSIGEQTLDVVRHLEGRFQIACLSAGSSADRIISQAREFRPDAVHLSDESAAATVRQALSADGIEVLAGPAALEAAATVASPDMVVVATVGWTGVLPTLAAIDAGAEIALANKEVLVCAGEVVMPAARGRGVGIWPVDSEHNAIMQCLVAGPHGPVAPLRRIILTCSGGPFRNAEGAAIASATAAETLDHPTWDMGRKITVDSATLMNKGFEVIEAHHLFAVAYDQIEVIVHPQSIIHSMVEFIDGSMIAQLGVTDMRLPIQNVLTHPERAESATAPLDLAAVGSLTFQAPDTRRFPCLAMAYECGRRGGIYPCVLNAANEVAVAAHLAGEIPCGGIPRLIAHVVAEAEREVEATGAVPLDLDRLTAVDGWARATAQAALDGGNIAPLLERRG